ncbi:MAG TPA: hypothetical protein VK983_04890 [Candidatus Limnocylindrales bacterium]|nr:hypothetical protein [Candidatus Limnocylindrales bacterium]
MSSSKYNASAASKAPYPLLKRLKLFSLILLVLLLAGVGLVIYSKYQAQQALLQENARFADAEREIPQLADRIVAAAGQPLKRNDDKSCFLRSVKFEKQPISCTVMSDLYYGVDSLEEAQKLHELAKANVPATWTYFSNEVYRSSPLQEKFEPIDLDERTGTPEYDQIVHHYTKNEKAMRCGLTVFFYHVSTPPYENMVSMGTKPYVANTVVSCDMSSTKTHYPIR